MLNIKKVRPMFNRIVTTMDKYETDQYQGSLVDTQKQKGTIKEYQKVVAVGTTVRDIKVGDTVIIDPTRYMVVKHNDKSLKKNLVGDEIGIGYKFNTMMLDGKEHLILFDQDISYIVDEYEEKQDPVIIQAERPNIVV